MYRYSSKNAWTLFLLILAGIVLGSFAGEYLGRLPNMDWLRYERMFGSATPFPLDLSIIKIQFALLFRFNIAGVIGVLLAILVYRRL